MLDGDQWKTGVEAPTPADIRKYHATGARLLIEREVWGKHPAVITDILNGGELFCINGGYGIFDNSPWLSPSDIRVLAIFPPPEPPKADLSDLPPLPKGRGNTKGRR